jgi:hypothetical protein
MRQCFECKEPAVPCEIVDLVLMNDRGEKEYNTVELKKN